MKQEDLIRYKLEKADDALIEADKMAEIKHWNTCINRLYYACFYAVSALLLANDFTSVKHSGVRGLFNLHYIKTELLPKSLGRLYNELFIYRQQSDYEDMFLMDEERVLPLIFQTKEFVSIIKKKLMN
ncbi:MAG: HEPN domain-containing protein [Candidatus Cloacimonetes bacterium]|nr:HEPN domain-containing protein [Candidatus Cloacimonadota bacterium]